MTLSTMAIGYHTADLKVMITAPRERSFADTPRKASQHGRHGECPKKRWNGRDDGPHGQCEERRPLAVCFGEHPMHVCDERKAEGPRATAPAAWSAVARGEPRPDVRRR